MKQPSRSLFKTKAFQWAAVILSIAAATLVRWLLDPVLGIRLPFVTYLVAIYFLAWSTSLWPGIVALALAAWTADFFFVAPRFTWWPHWQNDVDYVGTSLYFIVGGTGIAICEAMRRAQHEAAEQAERLRTTLASIGDAVMTTDSAGRITGLNPVAESLTGWTNCEALGQPLEAVFRIVNEQTRRTVENPATRALRDGLIVGLANHTLLIAKDGSERPIEDSASPIRCADGEIVGCVLVFRDVAERRQAERELRESEARKAAILETALDCVITIDHEGKIIEFNPAAEKTFGHSRQQVLGREMAELIVPPAFREQYHQGLARFLKTGHGPALNKRIQMPALRADATEIPVELSIAAIQRQEAPPIFTAYICDVTAPLRTEKRRAARLAVTQIVAEAGTVDDAASRIIQAICESLSWDVGAMWLVDPQENVLRCVEVWHQSGLEVDDFEALTRKCRFTQGVGLPGRIWMSSEPAWIPDVVKDTNFPRAPIADREGLHGAFGFPLVIGPEFLGVIEFFSHEIREPDVDLLEMMSTIGSQVGYFIERKRTEDALRRVAAELSEADRRKDEFLAMLAHELRNPLAPIRNALQIMRLTSGNGHDLHSASEMMERQIGQMVRLVDDLLDVSRISRGKIELRCEPVELSRVIEHAVDAAASIVRDELHQLSVTLPSEPIYVHADSTRIAQIIGNLLSNACKFTNQGGRISIIVERDGEQAVIRVKDTGIGIAADQQLRIFDMFAQVDSSLERTERGLGIGLTLVKSLVDMHGGTVEVRSDGIGHGSEFVVRLPILADAPQILPSEPTDGELLPVVPRRILVVDDNRDAAISLSTLLKLDRHETQTAYDGLEAVEAAESFRPEVILLDIGLPKLNGYEVARQIRNLEWGKNVMLVALTGWGKEEDRRRSQEAGFDAHLVKPVNPANLMKLLAETAPAAT